MILAIRSIRARVIQVIMLTCFIVSSLVWIALIMTGGEFRYEMPACLAWGTPLILVVIQPFFYLLQLPNPFYQLCFSFNHRYHYRW